VYGERVTRPPSRLRAFFRGTFKWSSRAALLLMLVVGIAAAVAGSWLYTNIFAQLPADLSQYKTYRPPTSCRVFAANGELTSST
jgi:membrane carboxypeptidase/penicillin-binding protein